MTEKKRILLVDDERDLVEELMIRLEACGWEVLTACDGQEGLEKARRERPDLILLDVIMPKMNGYQVCRELKGVAETKMIPIILLTAKAQENDKRLGKESGADDYIIKPSHAGLLIDKIKKYLGEN